MSSRKRSFVSVFVLSVLATVLVFPATGSARQPAKQTQGSARAGTGTVAAPQPVTFEWQSKPPVRTKDQIAQLKAAEARAMRPSPITASAPGPAPAHAPYGPELLAPDKDTSSDSGILAVPNAFGLFKDTFLPVSRATPYGDGFSSNTQEPSIDSFGKYVFATGNWYTTRSTRGDDATSFEYLDPFVAYSGVGPNDGSQFCCHQVSLYDGSRDQQFWLMQGTDGHLKLGRSGYPSNLPPLGVWCFYTLGADSFGGTATDQIDYNDMALSNDFLYIASNIYSNSGTWTRSSILRIPLDDFAKYVSQGCPSITTSFFSDTSYFTFKPVQGATDVMYWGSDGGGTLGQSIRLYSWAENSLTINFFDRAVAAFTYMVPGGGQQCGGGPVANWCESADSRLLGGYVARRVIGFSFNAMQDGSHPFPFTRVVRFDEGSKASIGATDYWSSGFAVQYMTWAPNKRGNLGATFAWGGGTASKFWYPGTAMLVQDEEGVLFYYRPGGSNACVAGSPPRYSWGQYLTIRPSHPGDLAWIATGMRNVNGGPCTAGGYSEIHHFVFGRERDRGSYRHWAER